MLLLTELNDRVCSITYYIYEAYIGCCKDREGAVIMALFYRHRTLPICLNTTLGYCCFFFFFISDTEYY